MAVVQNPSNIFTNFNSNNTANGTRTNNWQNTTKPNNLQRTPKKDEFQKGNSDSNKKQKNILISAGVAVATAAGLLFGHKLYKSNQIANALEKIEQKFVTLQDNMPEVQKTFKEVFLRGDISEKEAREMLNRYKEIEKLGVTGTKKEYIQALFEEANRNYKIKPIELRLEFERKSCGGSTNPLNEYIKINPNRSIDEYWDIIHHELRHAKQHILAYNSNPKLARECVASSIPNLPESIQKEAYKYVEELIDKGVMGDELKKRLANKYNIEVDELLSNNFGVLNPNNVPTEHKKLAKDLMNSMAECDRLNYVNDPSYYMNRFHEVDARFAGESIAKLFNKPIFIKS